MFAPGTLATYIINAFVALGLFLSLTLVYRFLSFIWIYFLRASTVEKYLTGQAPYAVITGATDGIGKAVAKELYHRGFNLILHGRSEEKIKNVVEEIKACGGNKDIRYFLADATLPGHDFRKMLEEFQDLNITLLINNVGGTTGVKLTRIDEWADEEVYGTVRWTALFPLGITRALLPQLRRSPGSVLVVFVGSFSGDVPAPRIALYSASKQFIEGLSWALTTDERYFTSTNVQFMYACVGQVSTKGHAKPVSLLCPSPDVFARAFVNQLGCGRRRIAPYFWHAISHWSVEVLGEWLAGKVVAETMRRLYFADLKGAKMH